MAIVTTLTDVQIFIRGKLQNKIVEELKELDFTDLCGVVNGDSLDMDLDDLILEILQGE